MIAGDEDGFEQLARVIARRAGLSVEAYKPRCIRRRIAVRMRANQVSTYEEYLRVLERSPEEYQKLADALTINVTRFFRNPELWDRMAQLVLPALWALDRPLRAWSAGCASGEEPYTLSMLFGESARAAGHPEWAGRLLIDATDIDRASLDRAREAWYPEAAFIEMPPPLRDSATVPEGDGRRVTAQVRARVRVRRLDLLTEAPPHPPYDLIVCRNVIIYFDRPTQDRLFETFTAALRPGGFLVLGKVETILGPVRDRLEMVDGRERIYRRPG